MKRVVLLLGKYRYSRMADVNRVSDERDGGKALDDLLTKAQRSKRLPEAIPIFRERLEYFDCFLKVQ